MTPSATRSRRARAVAALVAAAAAAILFGVAAAGGEDAPAAGTTMVEITAHQSRFTPASVTVPAGATVRFVIHNLDPIDHEFIVGGPEVHRQHEVGREAHHRGELPGEISVPAGATVSTTWTAPSSPGPVTYACHLPEHFAYGMAGVVHLTP